MALRLPVPPEPPGHGPAAGPGPVVVFLPAHDEEATVAAVVARVPALVAGRRVECLVVDDGSRDRTAERAAAAGATVLSSAVNRGLGAAVRRGLGAATERGAAAVAFCDADREYDPAELERLVAPILEGRADYVVGSRFAGEIRRMLPQRRLGNLALTGLLRFVARAPIGDGQSGFRALSGAAAAAAEIAHDYNYAQVLTLDLLAKGYRYLEVPIGYQFRTAGRSFVRPWSYLRRVVPTVRRELDRHHRASAAPTHPGPRVTHPTPRRTHPGPRRTHPGPRRVPRWGSVADP
jgi:glycosyltransferase involved in cell wall biosynthesis